MKTLLIVLILLLPVISSAASCKDIYEVSKSIMFARQENVPLPGLLKITEKVGDKAMKEAVAEIILTAYEYPVMQLQENKIKVAIEFANKISRICYQSGV